MKSWYEIRAKSGDDSAEIFIYDQIGYFGITAKQFIDDLKNLSAKTINLRINSPGGEMFDGFAIYNALQRHEAKKIVTIDGLAASMASLIAMVGDKILMPENSYLMIHNPFGIEIGDADDMRAMAELLDKLTQTAANTYAKRSGQSVEKILELMKEETWLPAAEALELGLADKVIPAVKIAASYSLSKFKKPPQAIADAVTANDNNLLPKADGLVVAGFDIIATDAPTPHFDAMMKVAGGERRAFFATELRTAGGPGRTLKITGHAAVYNQLSEELGFIDPFREMILPGAFTRSLRERDVRCLFNHDENLILGRTKSGTLKLTEDETGLRIENTLPDTQYARDLFTSIERGDVDSMSFGFVAVKDHWRVKNGVTIRELHDVDLWDVSPTTFPAYPQTDVAVRSAMRAKIAELRAEAVQPTPDSIPQGSETESEATVSEAPMIEALKLRHAARNRRLRTII